MPALPGLDADGFEGGHAADEDGRGDPDPDKVPADVGKVLGAASGPRGDPWACCHLHGGGNSGSGWEYGVSGWDFRLDRPGPDSLAGARA